MSMTKNIFEKAEKTLKEIQTERGKIEVQLHLLNMNAKDEWDELEKKYAKFKTKTSSVADVTADSAGEVAEAIKLVGEELHEGYKRIRDSM